MIRRPGGSQYTLSFHKANGEVREALPLLSRIGMEDVMTDGTDENHRIPETAGDKTFALQSLYAAGIQDVDPAVVKLLPTRQQVAALYGEQIVILGQETCAAYQARVAPQDRYVGVAGLFNTGTTALQTYLKANVFLPQSKVQWDQLMEPYKYQHTWEVPWGKHRLRSLRDRFFNEGAENLIPDHVLPVVIVRDPFTWMQSMCTASYMARWRHSRAHCPNLVPNRDDLERFPGLVGKKTVPVALPAQNRLRFDSLAHLYRNWYQEWVGIDHAPRLVVRLEDLIFYPEIIVRTVQECVQAIPPPTFRYVLGSSKWFHEHIKPQSNRVTAMIKYGQGLGRLNNMTSEDLDLANTVLADLMQVFHYRPARLDH